MKITNTHFILGTILFVVIMISLTTSCCDFMPYSRQRGSLGMSVYEGMDGEGDEEEKKKTQEGLEGDEEEKKEGMEGEEDKMKKLFEEEKMKKLFEEEKKKEGDKKEKKEGFTNGKKSTEGLWSRGSAFNGGARGPGSVFNGGAGASSSAFNRTEIGSDGVTGGANIGSDGVTGGGGGWSGRGSGGGWSGRGSQFVAVNDMTTSGQHPQLSIHQQLRGFRKPGKFETITNNTEPSPMSALAQSVFGSSVPWTK